MGADEAVGAADLFVIGSVRVGDMAETGVQGEGWVGR